MIELKFSLDIKDLKMFGEKSNTVASSIDKVIKRVVTEIRNTAVTNIQRGSRTGKTYKRGSITHQASAPGEYPKSDTGRLVSSIRTDFNFLKADIGSDVNYSAWLENGTSKMKPRPWLKPSFDANHENMLTWINDALKQSFNL